MIVEYFLSCPHGIIQFEPVCRELLHLGIETYFVIPDFITTDKICYEILNKKKLPFKTKMNPHADIAITLSNHKFLYNYNNLKIKFKYGVNVSKNAYNMSKIGACGFDGILVHGQYEKDLIEKRQVIPSERIRMMGYPKHDNFFLKKKSTEQIKKKLHINAPVNKKIITYFPTWGKKSSIDLYYKSLLKLKKKYYIVTKPHHNTFYSPKEKLMRWKKLEQISDHLLDPHTPFAHAVTIADIIIADGRSGSLSEATLINPTTPLIGLHVADKSPKNYYHPDIFSICTLIDNPKKLQNVVLKMTVNALQSEKRKLFAQYIFSYIGQNCAKIAAKEIIELSKVKKISPKPQPPLKLQPLWLRNCKQTVKDIIKFFIK